MELSPKVGRMCAMNVYLHNIGGDKVVVHSGHDSLSTPWNREYSMVLTNPPFGKKQSLLFVNEEGETEKDDQIIVREDFWTSTSNKQLNFVQHIYTLLKIDGRAAVVVPDNVLFEGGAGEKVRRNLLEKCRVHTLLRLPTGIWYSPGVKANVIFFEKRKADPKRGPTGFGSTICAPTCTSRSSRSRFVARTSTSLSSATNPVGCTSARLRGARTIPRAAGGLMTTTTC